MFWIKQGNPQTKENGLGLFFNPPLSRFIKGGRGIVAERVRKGNREFCERGVEVKNE